MVCDIVTLSVFICIHCDGINMIAGLLFCVIYSVTVISQFPLCIVSLWLFVFCSIVKLYSQFVTNCHLQFH